MKQLMKKFALLTLPLLSLIGLPAQAQPLSPNPLTQNPPTVMISDSYYEQLMDRIKKAYQNASNSFRSPEVSAKILQTLDAFNPNLVSIAEIKRTASKKMLSLNDLIILSQNGLKLLDENYDQLQTILQVAAKADQLKVERTEGDPSSAAAMAETQKTTDESLSREVQALLTDIKKDLERTLRF